MSELTHLIRRDLPLEPGRKLRFSFTVAFEVTLDENNLDYAGDAPGGGVGPLSPSTLDELERFVGDTHRSSESIYRALANNYDRNVIEHEVRLDDRYEGADEGELRFEHTWEARDREAGRSGMWSSRVWLDEVPTASQPPYGPGSNPPVPAPSVGASADPGGSLADVDFATAEEIMAREG